MTRLRRSSQRWWAFSSGPPAVAELLGDLGPAHELVDGEELEELGVEGHLRVTGVAEDAVEEVVLLVVVRSEDDEVDDALEGL